MSNASLLGAYFCLIVWYPAIFPGQLRSIGLFDCKEFETVANGTLPNVHPQAVDFLIAHLSPKHACARKNPALRSYIIAPGVSASSTYPSTASPLVTVTQDSTLRRVCHEASGRFRPIGRPNQQKKFFLGEPEGAAKRLYLERSCVPSIHPASIPLFTKIGYIISRIGVSGNISRLKRK
ncbi:hypothetical protein BKA93DRAFT_750641 [Sparassis latifolia]